jgi:deoxyribodipyrimidine photo-lyase
LKKQNLPFPDSEFDKAIINKYHETRDIPSINGTTRLSVHLRFGTISIRKLGKLAFESNATYLNELIWRDFYMMILWHFPHVAKNSFKPNTMALFGATMKQILKLGAKEKLAFLL